MEVKKTKESQRRAILGAMLEGSKLTALDGLRRFGSLSFAKRISEIVSLGYPIVKEWIKTKSGKRVIRYSIDNQQSKM